MGCLLLCMLSAICNFLMTCLISYFFLFPKLKLQPQIHNFQCVPDIQGQSLTALNTNSKFSQGGSSSRGRNAKCIAWTLTEATMKGTMITTYILLLTQSSSFGYASYPPTLSYTSPRCGAVLGTKTTLLFYPYLNHQYATYCYKNTVFICNL